MANRDKYRAIVNGAEIRFKDQIPDGGQILSKADFDPADEYVLIQLLRHESRSISLDEPVELREDGAEVFKAFRSDRIYRFTIDNRGYEWGNAKIAEPELRELAGVGEDQILILQQDGEDRELESEDIIDLGDPGTEHLLTASRLINVFLDGESRMISRGTHTTEQLLQLLEVESGYLLNVLKNGQLNLLEPGDKIRVKDGMHFITQVPCGGAA